MAGGLMSLSDKELGRLQVAQEVVARRLRVVTAAARLGFSPRQVKRHVRAYRQEGAQGLVSRLRGKPSNHRFGDGFKAKGLGYLRGRYAGFGQTLRVEDLRQEDLSLSTSGQAPPSAPAAPSTSWGAGTNRRRPP